MDVLLAWVPLLAPLAFLPVFLLSLRRPGSRPEAVIAATPWAAAVGGLATAGTAARLIVHGSWTTPLVGIDGLGFALRVDALSVTMLGLVAFMGWILLRYSRNYLDGDERHGRFLGLLALTVASVMLLVLAGNLVHLAVFWAVTSFSLHRLLLFYPERVGARVAGRKKFIVARAGDVALALAVVLLVGIFGTGDLAAVLERAAGLEAASPGPLAPGLLAATLLVAVSAILKSAQFPTHGWLIEVMETPTPVSALLHAGIINGGTFLVVRLGEVVLLTPAALHLLIVVGGFTALFASVVMTTQNSVKVALGYSSAAHMGFMLLLCGLGAFPVAILHLVAHSFYKAHAFLSSGSAVEAFQGGPRAPDTTPSLGIILAGIVAALATVGGVAAVLGVSPWEEPVTLGLAGVVAIGLTQLWSRGLEHAPAWRVVARTAAAAAGTTVAFFGLELGAAALLGGAVPFHTREGPVALALMAGVVASFALAVVVQLRLPAMARSPGWARLWVHLRNGLYANAVFDRFVGALTLRASDLQTRESL